MRRVAFKSCLAAQNIVYNKLLGHNSNYQVRLDLINSLGSSKVNKASKVSDILRVPKPLPQRAKKKLLA